MAEIEFYPEDYIDEIDTEDLIEELKSRKVLPKSFDVNKEMIYSRFYGRTPKRDAIIEFLELHETASLEDIIEAVKENYNK